MNRINTCFTTLAQQQRKALVAFCTANYPSTKDFATLLEEMPQAGVDIIEVGMPFSDPIADGPTIQRSNKVSLAEHTKVADILTNITKWRATNQHTPLILMGYYNPVLQFGEDAFIQSCCAAGVDGVILVDLPPEESQEFFTKAEAAGLAMIHLITPTTTEARMQQLCAKLTQGFVYYVAVTGVTGGKKAQHNTVLAHITKLRSCTNLPIAVGFGIANPEDAATMAQTADGIVVGSALIRAIEEGGIAQGLTFLRSLQV